MLKSYDSFWGTPEKLRKLVEDQVGALPEIHFLFKVTKENVDNLLKDSGRSKVVLLTIFPESTGES